MKVHQPIGFDAANPGMTNFALPGQGIPRVFDPANNLPLVVADEGVDVHLVPAAVLEYKIMLPLVIPRYMPVAQSAEDAEETRQVLLVDGNVQIGMGAGLPPQVGVYRPAAVDNDRDGGNL